MTDAAREGYISHCAFQMKTAIGFYEAYGFLADHDAANYWRTHMEAAIGQRSPAQLAAMAAEQAWRAGLHPGAAREGT